MVMLVCVAAQMVAVPATAFYQLMVVVIVVVVVVVVVVAEFDATRLITASRLQLVVVRVEI